MSKFYKDMPQDFKGAVEVIKRYCQNENCEQECAECTRSLGSIRCGDTKKEEEIRKQNFVEVCRKNNITNGKLMDMYRLR